MISLFRDRSAYPASLNHTPIVTSGRLVLIVGLELGVKGDRL